MLLSHFNNPLELLVILLSFVAALTIHEFAHAFVADRLGDPTARLMGRLSLNPLAHLDPLGTLMLLFAPFGWAKPVPFDPFNLRNPRRDSALISLAGPVANLLLAFISAIIIRCIPISDSIFPVITLYLLEALIVLNVNLAIFNLIPIHPLDGFKVVEGMLPENAARQWAQLQNLGFLLILVLVFPVFGSSPVLNLIQPVIRIILSILLPGSPSI